MYISELENGDCVFEWLKNNSETCFKKELVAILLCIGVFDLGVALFFYYILYFNLKTYSASNISEQLLIGAILFILVIFLVKVREVFVMQQSVEKKDSYIENNLNRALLLKKKQVAVSKMDTIKSMYAEENLDAIVSYVKENIGYEKKKIVKHCDSVCLNAIISNYIYKTESTGIEFKVECLEKVNDLNLQCGLDSKITNTIFGNLLDNAVEALSISLRPDKLIHFIIKREKDELVYIVWNNGPRIKDVSKIFKSRYSTKGKGRGMGMVAVSRIVDSCNASFNVESTEELTQFEIRFQIV